MRCMLNGMLAAVVVFALGGKPLGAPVSEPALLGRADILLFEDFERKDWNNRWRTRRLPRGYSWGQKPSPVFLGQGSLEVTHTPGTHDPSEIHPGIPETDVAYVRWYRYYEPGYDWTQHKMPGFYAHAGGRSTGAGVKPTGTDKFSCKLFVDFRGYPAFYAYNPDQKGRYGDHLPQNVGGRVRLEEGKWYCFELMLKANNAPARDGEVKMWINNELKGHHKDIRFRDTNDLKINTFTYSAYVGGTWTSKREQRLWDDNIVIALNYIGPFVMPAARRKKRESKPFIFIARAKKPKDVLDGLYEELKPARDAASKGDHGAASEACEELASGKEAAARERLLLLARGYGAAVRLRELVAERAGTRPATAYVNVMGRPMRGKVLSADETGVEVNVMGSTMRIGWERLSPRRFLALGRKFLTGEELILAAEAAFALGLEERAKETLAGLTGERAEAIEKALE